MPRACTVCRHRSREAIDLALVTRRTSFRDIARQYRVGKDALGRHLVDHVPEHLAKAETAREIVTAGDLLAEVQGLYDRALAILTAAETEKDHKTALGAIRESRGSLELLGRLLGELKDAPTLNVLVTAEWQAVQGTLLRALGPFPEARAAVAGQLQILSGGTHAARP